jgi:hypothetical protein
MVARMVDSFEEAEKVARTVVRKKGQETISIFFIVLCPFFALEECCPVQVRQSSRS